MAQADDADRSAALAATRVSGTDPIPGSTLDQLGVDEAAGIELHHPHLIAAAMIFNQNHVDKANTASNATT